MTFSQATDRLMQDGVTLQEIAQALGIAYTTVRAMRLDPTTSSYRKPPEGWEAALRELAQGRGESLRSFAEELE